MYLQGKTIMNKSQLIEEMAVGVDISKASAARTGRNPQTGAEIQIAAAKVPGFKAGKGLK